MTQLIRNILELMPPYFANILLAFTAYNETYKAVTSNPCIHFQMVHFITEHLVYENKNPPKPRECGNVVNTHNGYENHAHGMAKEM